MDASIADHEERTARFGRGRQLRRWGQAAAVALVLAATLFPTGDRSAPEGWTFCVICGEFGTATSLLNVALFFPLGVALAGTRASLFRLTAIGFALSLSVELAQQIIPGRNSALSDLIFNALGLALGVGVTRAAPLWVYPSRRRSRRLALAAAGMVVGVVIATGQLARSSYPESEYYGQWTAELGHMAHYDGRVLSVDLGGRSLPAWRLEDSGRVREALASGSVLTVIAEAGSRPASLAPVFSIYDDEQREIVLVGLDGGDLVVRTRIRAADLRFYRPELRIPGVADAVMPGDTFTVRVWQENMTGRCVAFDRAAFCGKKASVGTGWSFLFPATTVPVWLQAPLGLAWIAALFVPLGFWARPDRASWAALAIAVAGIAVMPSAFDLAPVSAPEWAGALAGMVAGLTARGLVRSGRHPRRSDRAPRWEAIRSRRSRKPGP